MREVGRFKTKIEMLIHVQMLNDNSSELRFKTPGVN